MINVKIEELKGKIITGIQKTEDEIIFKTDDLQTYKMYHSQDCCESVSIEDICGDLQDLIGAPILLAEEESSTDPDKKVIEEREAKWNAEREKHFKAHGNFDDWYSWGPNPHNDWKEESETWTFYKLATIKGSVTIRWWGQSNGYYSEHVDFVRMS